METETKSVDKMSERLEKCAVAKLKNEDYVAVVTEINATKLFGEAGVFQRGTHVLITLGLLQTHHGSVPR